MPRSRRPPLGIIFAGDERVARVDLASADGPVVGTPIVRPRGSNARLADAVASVLDSVSSPARLIVLDEHAWTQCVELPAAQVSGLDDAALARALAFELEPLSGIPASDAAVGVRRQDGGPLWVTEVRASDLAELHASLANREEPIVLEAVAHPAGIALDAGAPMIEVWSHATCCIAPNAPTVIVAASPGQRSWERAVAEWLTMRNGASVAWHGRPPSATLDRAGATLEERGGSPFERDLPGAAVRAGRIGALDSVRNPAARAVPSIRPVRPRRALLQPRLFALLLLLAAAIGCAADFISLSLAKQDDEARLETAQRTNSSIHRLRGAATTLDAKLAQLEKEVPPRRELLSDIEAEWSAQRTRFAALLDELSERRPESLALSAIEPDVDGALAIRGVGLTQAEIDRFAAELTGALRSKSLAVSPARTSAKSGVDSESYLEFSIRVEPMSAPEPDR